MRHNHYAKENKMEINQHSSLQNHKRESNVITHPLNMKSAFSRILQTDTNITELLNVPKTQTVQASQWRLHLVH